MKHTKSIMLFMMGMILISFSSCNGIFEGIYDDPSESQDSEYGFIKKSYFNEPGRIYVDASSYTQWIYINFHNFLTVTKDIELDKNNNGDYDGVWDIAVHRYDAKTNGAKVIETEFTDIVAFRDSGKMPQGELFDDVQTDSTIIVDTSQMADGVIGYIPSKVNVKLSEWLNRDMSQMPPIYTLSNKVYVIVLEDNTKAAVKLDNFMNAKNIKGFLTIDYLYPVEF